jgi:4-amino-4-deoxy-L-arabinose transferase-like glycosyltransferase
MAIRAARAGTLEMGNDKIAAAYLIDRHRVRGNSPLLPPGDLEAEHYLLSREMKSLYRSYWTAKLRTVIILIISMSWRLGVYSQNYSQNQEWIMSTLALTGDPPAMLLTNPSIERTPGCAGRMLGTLLCDSSQYYSPNYVKKLMWLELLIVNTVYYSMSVVGGRFLVPFWTYVGMSVVDWCPWIVYSTVVLCESQEFSFKPMVWFS